MIRWNDYTNPLDFMPASAYDYADWLLPWIKQGGKPTHYYDYPLLTGAFIIARRDFDVVPRFGANSLNIIIPSGIHAYGRDLGHSNLYFLGRNPSEVGGQVPVYSNDVFMQDNELRAAMRASSERRRTERESYHRQLEWRRRRVA